MNVRRGTPADLPLFEQLWREFEREMPEPPWRDPDEQAELGEVRDYVENALSLVAEDDGRPIGFALAKLETPRVCFVSDLYVRPEARRKGVAKALITEVASWCAGLGAEVLTLEILSANAEGRAVYERLGFDEESRKLVTPVAAIAGRLTEEVHGPSSGSIHVQTDDIEAVVRAVRQYVPRLPGGSRGSVVTPPDNGWTGVYDELCDREPAMLRRLALELSDRMGAVVLAIGIEHGDVVRFILFERARIVDEYLSVPEYHGPLPPGDVIGLGANPTVVARLTGADPARIREIARTAHNPAELAPAPELLAGIASAMGVPAATVAYGAAGDVPGAVRLDR